MLDLVWLLPSLSRQICNKIIKMCEWEFVWLFVRLTHISISFKLKSLTHKDEKSVIDASPSNSSHTPYAHQREQFYSNLFKRSYCWCSSRFYEWTRRIALSEPNKKYALCFSKVNKNRGKRLFLCETFLLRCRVINLIRRHRANKTLARVIQTRRVLTCAFIYTQYYFKYV